MWSLGTISPDPLESLSPDMVILSHSCAEQNTIGALRRTLWRSQTHSP